MRRRDEQREVAQRFAHACSSGDLDSLISVLDPDAVGDFDSGGHIPGAPLQAVQGARAVALLLRRSFTGAGCDFEVADINGEAGVVVLQAGQLVAVVAIGVTDGRVDHIHGIGNPDKLTEVRRIAAAPSAPRSHPPRRPHGSTENPRHHDDARSSNPSRSRRA